jgi:hypothetical protein
MLHERELAEKFLQLNENRQIIHVTNSFFLFIHKTPIFSCNSESLRKINYRNYKKCGGIYRFFY